LPANVNQGPAAGHKYTRLFLHIWHAHVLGLLADVRPSGFEAAGVNQV
jgi:hypothetical protein